MLRDGKGIRRGPTTVDILLAGITRVREILPTDSTTGKCRKAICRWVKKKKKKKKKKEKRQTRRHEHRNEALEAWKIYPILTRQFIRFLVDRLERVPRWN